MKQFNRKTGETGESIAADYLAKKHFQILERNFSNKFGEIDIIARDKDVLVFVEVKTKIGEDFGLPEDMVGRGKLQKIRNMATIYLNGASTFCRIDVVAIVLDECNNVSRLTHYENVI
jgi:putative endonuclease